MLGMGSQNYLIKVIFGLENKEFLSKLQATGSKMKSIGTSMTRNLTLPIVGAGVAIVKFSADFEKQMNFVQAVTNATGDDFEKLRKQALLLGRDTAFSASQSAEAQKFLGMAGFETNTILSAMPAVLDLAAAGQMDLAKAADIVTNVMTGMGVPVEEVRGAVDVLTNTFVQSNTSLSQLGEAFSYAATTASELGISIEEVSAGIGLLGNAGIQGSRAGTVLRNVMIRLSKINAQVANGIETNVTKAFKKMGMEIETAEGTMRSFTDLMADFRDATKDMTAVARKGLFSEIFGIRGGEATALLKATDAEFKAFVKSLEDSAGTAERIAKKQMEGFHGRMTMLKASLELLAISFGDSGILAMLTDLIQNKIIPFINSLSELDPWILKIIWKVAGFVAVLGPLIFILGALITHLTALGPLIYTIGTYLTGVHLELVGTIAILKSFAWAGLGASIANIAIALGLVVTPLAAVALSVRDLVNDIKDREFNANLAKILEDMEDPNFISSLENIEEETKKIHENIKGIYGFAGKGFPKGLRAPEVPLSIELPESVWAKRNEATKEYEDWMEKREDYLTKIRDKIEEIQEELKLKSDPEIKKALAALQKLEDKLNDVKKPVKEVKEEFVSWFQTINKMFSDENADKILGFFDKLTGAINDAKQAAKESQEAFEKWQKVFSGPAYPQMTEQVDAMREYAIEFFKATGKPFTGNILGKYGVPINQDEDGEDEFGEPKKKGEKDVKNMSQKLNDVFLESIHALTQSIQSGDIAGALQNMFNTLGDLFGQRMNDIIQKQMQNAEGVTGFGGQLLGSLGGGLVGVGIGLLGGLLGGGKKGRGDNPETPIFAHITNWKDFYQSGASMTSSFIFSGRAQGGYTDPHGRSLAFDIRDQQTGVHFAT